MYICEANQESKNSIELFSHDIHSHTQKIKILLFSYFLAFPDLSISVYNAVLFC